LIGWRHRRKLAAISGEDTVRVERVERRLAAILAADIAGYSRLMGEDAVWQRATLTWDGSTRREKSPNGCAPLHLSR
jgi:hypothetical protein